MTALKSREVKESPLHQGADESIVYQLTTTPWASSPSSPTVVVKDVLSKNAVVTTTVMPSGSAIASGDSITWPALTALVSGRVYRVEMRFVASGSTWEAFAMVHCGKDSN